MDQDTVQPGSPATPPDRPRRRAGRVPRPLAWVAAATLAGGALANALPADAMDLPGTPRAVGEAGTSIEGRDLDRMDPICNPPREVVLVDFEPRA